VLHPPHPTLPEARPRPQPRPAGDHRPQVDPACAGCPQLLLLRALKRAGVAASGRLSCEPGRAPWLADAERGAARVVISAGPGEPGVAPEGPHRLERLGLLDAAQVEAGVTAALSRPGTTWLVAVAPCPLGLRRAVPLRVVEARCNRCGACLALGCPAIEDPGGEAMSIDRATCAGCSLCAPLCRGRALVR